MKINILKIEGQGLVVFFLLLFAVSCKKDDDEISITDADGNHYHSVVIGFQTWMVENLMTTRLNDGTPLSNLTDAWDWIQPGSPGYCWYDNDASSNKLLYGALYNFMAVNSSRLCPEGWHVPDDHEWTTLIDYLGGDSIASSKMREAVSGAPGWSSNSTNSSGFSAHPGGFRGGAFFSLRTLGYWWSASSTASLNSYLEITSKCKQEAFSYGFGFSVRCLKD